jgi:Icc-related predicted phosphoesterase
MKITFISDSHHQHGELQLKSGDILVHCGDICNRGTEMEVLRFINWFREQPFKYKIFIAGNHDWFLENLENDYLEKILPKDIIYLNDSGICIDGINFWGSPIQPTFFDWAFNRNRGIAINKHWQLIPKNTDILITHGPPFGVLDQTLDGKNVGCEDLMLKINKIKPRIHAFGHIHEAYGIVEKKGTTFINASVLDIRYNLRNEPIIIDYNIQSK